MSKSKYKRILKMKLEVKSAEKVILMVRYLFFLKVLGEFF